MSVEHLSEARVRNRIATQVVGLSAFSSTYSIVINMKNLVYNNLSVQFYCEQALN